MSIQDPAVRKYQSRKIGKEDEKGAGENGFCRISNNRLIIIINKRCNDVERQNLFSMMNENV
jgi:hypothetical protein